MVSKRKPSAKNRKNKRKKLQLIWKTVTVLLLFVGVLVIFLIADKSKDVIDKESNIIIETTEKEKIKENILMNTLLEKMSLEEKIYQMFIVTPEQLTGVNKVTKFGDTTKNAIKKRPVGGIIYFSDNIVSREQCISMIDGIQKHSKIGLFIAVDEEGGNVARIGNNPSMNTTSFPNMQTIGGSEDSSKAYQVGYTIGNEISELGFNLDFAPVADVFSNPNNTVIGARAFSSNPMITAEMVEACVQGFKDSGILCTLKHFPGHGDTEQDSHYEEVSIHKNLEQLYECELIPFQEGIKAGASMVMVGHINVPEITKENVPASISEEIVTDLLREELGFTEIVITDSMSMRSITERYSSEDAAVRAIQAGVDIILMPEKLESAVAGILNAIEDGTISEERINESVTRILKQKIQNGIVEYKAE